MVLIAISLLGRAWDNRSIANCISGSRAAIDMGQRPSGRETVVASFPGSPGTRIEHAWRAWYIFSHDHDVIKIGPEFLEQKDILRIIQPILCSTLGVYDIRSPIARYK